MFINPVSCSCFLVFLDDDGGDGGALQLLFSGGPHRKGLSS
uniref:Putative LRR receptor-like serine/threonine-protein kinase At4g36180 n=1 Tax=Rhizophora mucronata TaxID=61149 RepID=A0A2P2MWQ2_RHIMU